MDVYKILLSILDKPDAPKFYRELRGLYEAQGKLHEAAAIGHLIEKKFGKKDATPNGPPSSQE